MKVGPFVRPRIRASGSSTMIHVSLWRISRRNQVATSGSTAEVTSFAHSSTRASSTRWKLPSFLCFWEQGSCSCRQALRRSWRSRTTRCFRQWHHGTLVLDTRWRRPGPRTRYIKAAKTRAKG